MKLCCTCKQQFSTDRFGKNRSTKDGLQKQCTGCRAERSRLDSEKNVERAKRWQEANPERRREIGRRWARDNPEGYANNAARRRALVASSIPPQANTPEEQEKIKAIYAEARRLTKDTGIPHEVDHVFPLAAGGWHVSSNLQILTTEANRRKGTSYNPLLLYQGEYA